MSLGVRGELRVKTKTLPVPEVTVLMDSAPKLSYLVLAPVDNTCRNIVAKVNIKSTSVYFDPLNSF